MSADLWDLVDHYHTHDWLSRYEIITVLALQEHILRSELVDEAYDGLVEG